MNRMVVFPKFTAFLQHKEIFTLNCEHFIHSSRDACTARAQTVGAVRAVRHCPALSQLRQSNSPGFYYYTHLLCCLCTREQSDGSGSLVSSYPRTTVRLDYLVRLCLPVLLYAIVYATAIATAGQPF